MLPEPADSKGFVCGQPVQFNNYVFDFIIESYALPLPMVLSGKWNLVAEQGMTSGKNRFKIVNSGLV